MVTIQASIDKSDIPVYAAEKGKIIGGITFDTFVGAINLTTKKYDGVYKFEGTDDPEAARRAFSHLPGLGD